MKRMKREAGWLRALAVLVMSLVVFLTGCARTPAKEPAVDPTSAFGFPEAAEEGTVLWPGAEAWASMGLPDLSLKELSGISICRSKDASEADFFYYEAVTFICQPKYNTRFSVITERLDEAGIEGEVVEETVDQKVYIGTYELAGEPMAIEVREDGIGWLYITVMGHAVKMNR